MKDIPAVDQKITLHRTIFPCDVLITTQWQIEDKTEIFVCDPIAITLIIKPVIWNKKPLAIEMTIPTENSQYLIGGLTRYKFELCDQITIPLIICPIKPGPLYLPIPEFQNEKEKGIFFEKINNQSEHVVLPREESCRRYFKEPNR